MDTEETKAHKEMIMSDWLYPKASDCCIGASGALARSETSEANISGVASHIRSITSKNVCKNYQQSKIHVAKERGDRFALEAFLCNQGFDLSTVIDKHRKAQEKEYNLDNNCNEGEDDKEEDCGAVDNEEDDKGDTEMAGAGDTGCSGQLVPAGAASQDTHAEP